RFLPPLFLLPSSRKNGTKSRSITFSRRGRLGPGHGGFQLPQGGAQFFLGARVLFNGALRRSRGVTLSRQKAAHLAWMLRFLWQGTTPARFGALFLRFGARPIWFGATIFSFGVRPK